MLMIDQHDGILRAEQARPLNTSAAKIHTDPENHEPLSPDQLGAHARAAQLGSMA